MTPFRSGGLLAGAAGLAVSLAGIVRPQLYGRVLDPAMAPGVLSQDLVSAFVGLGLLGLMLWPVRRPVAQWGLVMGMLWYLFYAYGLYVIERLYTGWYLVYMVIMGVCFYTLAWGVGTMGRMVPGRLELARPYRRLAAGVCLFSPLLFYPLWTVQLLELMAGGIRPDHYYGVYILDMVFVLPAYVAGAMLVLTGRREGLILVPALCVKGFTLLFSVGLSVMLTRWSGGSAFLGEGALYVLLAAGFLGLLVVHLKQLREESSAEEPVQGE